MAGVNKAIVVGNLGNDPEIRYAANGSAIASISVATSERWKDKNSGEQQERTEWHRIKLFGRQAELAGEYLKKARRFILRDEFRPLNTKIKMAMIAGLLRSSLER